jgi:hypothetical protein
MHSANFLKLWMNYQGVKIHIMPTTKPKCELISLKKTLSGLKDTDRFHNPTTALADKPT